MHTTALSQTHTQSRSHSSSLLRIAGLSIAGSVLLAASAHVAVPLPWTPVPMTLQTFALALLALMLGPVAACGASVAYLLEGAAGLPVFQPHGLGGVVQLLGITGGFLMSYPVAAYVGGLLARGGASFMRNLGAAAVTIAIAVSCGAVWFATMTHLPMRAVLAATVIPFLAGESVKIFAAAGIASAVQRSRQ